VFVDDICSIRPSSTKLLERPKPREGCINRDIGFSLCFLWTSLNSCRHSEFVSLRGKYETLFQRPYSHPISSAPAQLRGQASARIAPDVSLPLLANGPSASRAVPSLSLSTPTEAIYAIHSALRAKPKTTNHCLTPHQYSDQITDPRPT